MSMSAFSREQSGHNFCKLWKDKIKPAYIFGMGMIFIIHNKYLPNFFIIFGLIYKLPIKVTKVTKITTTRSIRQVPVDPDDLYFDSDGMVAPADETLLMDSRGRFLDGELKLMHDSHHQVEV